MEILSAIATNLEHGDSAKVKELLQKALSLNISPEIILNSGLIKGMEAVGKKFKANEIFIPEVLIASRAMKSAMDVIKPHLLEGKEQFFGKILLGTVKGDLHDIGKMVVRIALEREGYEIIDIGIDVSKETFLETVQKEKPDILGMSALLTTTMSYMRDVIDTIRSALLKKEVKIIIGGAPITQSFADEIGADGYAPEAESAVTLVRTLIDEAVTKRRIR
ncbi:MAG: corrinoid protein [Candidatus Aminicenantes bacterium]|jgi:5-methyltetrahydrofolate--homocysteine methyltransferase